MTDAAVAIVGGGITGLTAAFRLAERLPKERLLVVERDTRLGGKIRTEYTGGFVLEGGPDSFLTAKPGGMELCRALGLADRLVGTLPTDTRSYVRRNGRLFELPEGVTGLIPSRLGPLLASPLLSWRGRARAGLDLVLPRRHPGEEESIATFVRRRLGTEVYDWLVEPLLSGIYAGDGAALSLDATFPQLRLLEQNHGSLIRGIVGQPRRPPATGSPFVTPAAGLSEVVAALEQRLDGAVFLEGTAVGTVHPVAEGYRLQLTDGRSLLARGVILATPAFVSARLVAGFDPALATALEAVPFVSTATVALGFPAGALARPLRGYGYLRPRAEGGPIVACTFVSSKWPGRAPDGSVLIRVFIGRAGREEVLTLDDESLVRLVRAELAEMLGITAEPRLTRVNRWPQGMPQYTVGHGSRVAAIDRALSRHPGLEVAGHSYHGIGIPDCIRSAERAAGRVLETIGTAEVAA